MPALSKSQQRFMGMVHAVQTGKLKAPSHHIADVAKNMDRQDVTDFAKTPHDGLPDHVKKAVSELARGIVEEAEHTSNLETRKQIAKDHLREDPKYYTKLEKCMKKADCATHDPNIPESFDARQKPIIPGKLKDRKAFAKGFAKAAMQNGLTDLQAVKLLLKSASVGTIGGKKVQPTVLHG